MAMKKVCKGHGHTKVHSYFSYSRGLSSHYNIAGYLKSDHKLFVACWLNAYFSHIVTLRKLKKYRAARATGVTLAREENKDADFVFPETSFFEGLKVNSVIRTPVSSNKELTRVTSPAMGVVFPKLFGSGEESR